MENRIYACIDIKSFFASAECFLLNLDPMKDNLVVYDIERGESAISLAITPAMKKLGIKNRCRIYEIPKKVKYISVNPRIEKYREISYKIYEMYLKYISSEDIYMYSIDECFIDITEYLNLYKMKAKEFVKFLQDNIYLEFKMYSSAGIGTNIFLSKVALDILAKNNKDGIATLTVSKFKEKILNHKPISDIWGIGKSSEVKLKKYGVNSLFDLSKLDEKILFKEFGISAQKMILHSKGLDDKTIKDLLNHIPEKKSYSISKTFITDKNYLETYTIGKKMIEKLSLKLIEKNYYAKGIALKISYYDKSIKNTGMNRSFENSTNLFSKIFQEFNNIFEITTHNNIPIRKITISLNNLKNENNKKYSLFENLEALNREENLLKTIVEIKKKFGEKSISRLGFIENN